MKVIVIGGGASGLVAAITAKKQGAEVLLLEGQNRVGKKILSTGNGRCNLSNIHADTGHYHGKNPLFTEAALQAFSPHKALAFFRELGLLTVIEESGKVYPLSDQANSVLDVLRLALGQEGVTLQTETWVTSIEKTKSGFTVKTTDETFSCDKIIVCAGGKAGEKVGGTDAGYLLLKKLGHHLTKLHPALVQIKTDNTYVRSLKGVRADGQITLLINGKAADKTRGEIQFTDYGISGPAAFEISRAVSTAEGVLSLRLNMLKDMTFDDIVTLLENRQKTMPSLLLEDFLTGILHNRLGRTLLRYAGYSLAESCNTLKPADIKKIAHALQNFTLPVLGTLGFEQAQITAGGIATKDFSPNTLESLLVPGLYAAGEVLDIDGDCGGFNLQWAWASGYLAAISATKQ